MSKSQTNSTPQEAKHLTAALPRVTAGETLSEEDCAQVVGEILQGLGSREQIAGFLVALRVRGETVEEITGAARALRSKMITVEAPAGAIDLCGTGGDNQHSLNISTAVGFVVAACGVPVAKHGSRAASSQSGASDVLAALGVNLDCPPEKLAEALRLHNHAFLFAVHHHAAMRYVAPVRAALKVRTLFNLVGPLCNPAGVKQQLLGSFSPDLLQPFANILARLGSERAWIVHGAGDTTGGYDELTLFGENQIMRLEDGVCSLDTLNAADLGLSADKGGEALRGGSAEDNAAAMRSIFNGTRGKLAVYADTVALNAAAALAICKVADGLADGLAQAQEALAGGGAANTLEAYINFTQEAAH